ncbi:C2 domain-containing protein [Glomus cerebriforme]|uniref:C2 domain-containing protein n=1 Tax=Glomus cerebriforme TaxID=658196 RepID=A0A397SX74_9GLOM|nr:C2 domain-containing protein [Glomus cerebriforme]
MTKGALEVTVVEAKKLHDEDWIGKGDPYVKLILDKFNSQATKPISGTNDPKYNETFTFNVDGQKELEVEVWDKDVAKDDLIGKNDVSLSKVFSSGQDDEWVKIRRHTIGFTKGEVHLSMKFTSA